jgi:hypothetical protein
MLCKSGVLHVRAAGFRALGVGFHGGIPDIFQIDSTY